MKLGIVGFGRIGQAVARRARGFDMQVSYTQPRRATSESALAPRKCSRLTRRVIACRSRRGYPPNRPSPKSNRRPRHRM
jgi:predicted dinucleotide-binding enzyme